VTCPKSPVQITALGIIALPHSQERHPRQPSRACAGTSPHPARVQSNRGSASAAFRRNSYISFVVCRCRGRSFDRRQRTAQPVSARFGGVSRKGLTSDASSSPCRAGRTRRLATAEISTCSSTPARGARSDLRDFWDFPHAGRGPRLAQQVRNMIPGISISPSFR
jgi:hypothetical protein